MRSIVAMSLLGGVIVVTPARTTTAQGAGPAARTSAERTLFALEDRWAEALVKRDIAYFRRTLASRYVYSDERGVFSRDQVIAEQTAASDTVTYAANDSMQARIYGNAAVVVGVLTVRGRNAQGAFIHRYRFTDSWARVQGRWLMIASQDYDMASR